MLIINNFHILMSFFKYLCIFLIILVTIFLIDLIWLRVMTPTVYEPLIGHLFDENVNYLAIVFFYIMYSIGILLLIFYPDISVESFLRLIFKSFMLGIVAYGTYELTNMATLKDWSWKIVIIDMIWGGFLTCFVSVITNFISQKVF